MTCWRTKNGVHDRQVLVMLSRIALQPWATTIDHDAEARSAWRKHRHTARKSYHIYVGLSFNLAYEGEHEHAR